MVISGKTDDDHLNTVRCLSAVDHFYHSYENAKVNSSKNYYQHFRELVDLYMVKDLVNIESHIVWEVSNEMISWLWWLLSFRSTVLMRIQNISERNLNVFIFALMN